MTLPIPLAISLTIAAAAVLVEECACEGADDTA